MSQGRLILTGAPDLSAFEAVVDRLSRLINVEANRIILASTPQDAARACAAADEAAVQDLTVLGVLGLEEALDPAGVTLIRLGPERAPLSAIIIANDALRETIAASLSQPAPALLEAGLDALRPAARLKARADREERDSQLKRAADLLQGVAGVERVRLEREGLAIEADGSGLERLENQFGLQGRAQEDALWLDVADAATARRLVDWLGVEDKARTATIRRTTKETDIALTVNLDGEGVIADTGVHFFDHMLDQIGRHGGIGLNVVCEGDVEVDAHHTIEDVCLALGEALREALGDKRGIARFGFETPMDETRASVWIDLSGRPFARFDGEIPGERVGDFPVEMCAHAFRSFAESLRAAIHVKVDGENAHHMVESCFKSFGRALRMAKTIEGDALPSTKGVL
jgi:imidazoleglycerol phosphate dehydratase HisB